MNNLVYRNRFKDGDLRAEVEVELYKLRENQYPYWSVTGTIKKGYGRDLEEISGAIGDRLIEYFPEIEPFERLHLSDGKGIPCWNITNGWYYEQTKNREALKNNLRLSDEETDVLMNMPDKDSFRYYIHVSGIEKRWNKESEDAIAELERLSGDKLTVDEGEEIGREVMTEEEVKAHEKKISEGYYNPDKVLERENKKKEEEREIALKDILDTYNKRKDDAVKMRDLMQLLIDGGVPYPCMLEVFSNKEVLVYVNQLKGVDSYYTEEEFDKLYEKLDKNDLIPEGFEIVKRKGY